jgi:TonB family protein
VLGRPVSPGYVAGAALAALAHGGLFAAVSLMGPSGPSGTAASDVYAVTLVDAAEIFPEPPPAPPEPEVKPPPAHAPEPEPAPPPAPVQTPAPSAASEEPPAVPAPGEGLTLEPAAIPSAPEQHPSAPDSTSASPAGNGQDELQAYMRGVRLQLARHAPRGVSGARSCEVEFHLSRNGEVTLVRLRSSSGKSIYDRRCVASVTSAAPFPEAPAGAKPADLTFSIEMKQKRPS